MFNIVPGYGAHGSNEVITTLRYSAKNMYECLVECLSWNCKTLWNSKMDSVCKIQPVSFLELNFVGDILSKGGWNLFYSIAPNSWIPIAKYSASMGEFNGDFLYELWNNPVNSMNNNTCSSTNESTRCNRHFIHKNKDWLQGLDTVTKVKVSLYKDGVEVAWVIFDKQPGSNDNWFQPSQIIDSYPRDTSSDMSLEPQQYNVNTRFYIVESNPDLYLRPSSPH